MELFREGRETLKTIPRHGNIDIMSLFLRRKITEKRAGERQEKGQQQSNYVTITLPKYENCLNVVTNPFAVIFQWSNL